ncbi:hypothetical protein BGZ57DRAFT_347124 [Hyaloscypha finlandica]|nr:hypothetical protein BGZ57DRAFT_347124 [Hyaloscypha finlandica]
MPKGGHHDKKSEDKRAHDRKKSHHDKKSDGKKAHDKKKSDVNDSRRKRTRALHLSYLDDHDPGNTNHPQFLDELPETKPHRYRPKELSYLLNQNASKRHISQLSATAQHRLKMPVRICDAKSDAQNLVNEWFPILDEIFFFSTVGPHLKNGIHVYNDPTPEADKSVYDNAKSWIEVNVGHELGHRRCERQFLATLLHEMVHAFLGTFSCGKKCCQDNAKEVKGHGSVWCNAMFKVKTKFEQLVGWEADFNIASSVMLEMEESSWQPRKDQLVRWGLANTTVFNEKLGRDVGFIRSEWSGVDEEKSDDERESDDEGESGDEGESDDEGESGDEEESENGDISHQTSSGRKRRHRKSSHQRKKHRKSFHAQFLDKLPNPKKNRFHPRELSNILQQNASKVSFSRLPAKAQLLFEKSVPSCHSTSEVRHLMKKWFRVLDEVFFFGKIRPHLKGGLIVYNKDYKRFYGQFDPNKRRIEINDVAHGDGEGRRSHRLISTLIHEMVHAFLGIYTCDRICCWRKFSTDIDRLFCGGGHGPAWCDAMIKIETKLEELVGWSVYTGMDVVVMLEMQNKRLEWQPTREQLVRWELQGKMTANPMFGDEETGFVRKEWPDSRHDHRHHHYHYEDSEYDSDGSSDDCQDHGGQWTFCSVM